MIDPLTLQDCKIRIAQGIAKVVLPNCVGKTGDDLIACIAENIELDPIIDYYENRNDGG